MSKFAFNRRQALAGFSSLVAASPLLRSQQTPPLKGEPPGRIAPHDELINTFEFEQMAKRKLDSEAYALVAGSDRREFDRMTYRPRPSVDETELEDEPKCLEPVTPTDVLSLFVRAAPVADRNLVDSGAGARQPGSDLRLETELV